MPRSVPPSAASGHGLGETQRSRPKRSLPNGLHGAAGCGVERALVTGGCAGRICGANFLITRTRHLIWERPAASVVVVVSEAEAVGSAFCYLLFCRLRRLDRVDQGLDCIRERVMTGRILDHAAIVRQESNMRSRAGSSGIERDRAGSNGNGGKESRSSS